MHAQILNYFKKLNQNLKDFPDDSFFRIDLMEIGGAFRTGINFPAMAVESPEGDAENSSLNNSVIGRTFAFTIYKNPERGNFDQQNIDLDDCEAIGKKLIARMRFDARKPTHWLYNRFAANSVTWIKVGPIFTEELHGYRFTGLIRGNENLQLDADDWQDVDQVC